MRPKTSRSKPPKTPCTLRNECPISCGWCKTHQPDNECVRLAKGVVEKWKHDVYPPDHKPDFDHWDCVVQKIVDSVKHLQEVPF